MLFNFPPWLKLCVSCKIMVVLACLRPRNLKLCVYLIKLSDDGLCYTAKSASLRLFSNFSKTRAVELTSKNTFFGFNNNHVVNNFHTSSPLLAKDYYKILGVAKNASQKEIKKAYYEVSVDFKCKWNILF